MSGLDLQTHSAFQVIDYQFNDNVNLILGTGGDATIDYNGTNLIIDPGVVGCGNLILNSGSLDLNNQGSLINIGAAGNDWTANLLVLTSTLNAQQIIRIANTRNGSVGDDAVISIQTGGDVGGDPMVEFTVTAQQTVVMGLDNTATDNFTISDNTALGTNDRLRLVTTTGVLSVDGDGGGSDDPVSLFDAYDDALELQRYAYTVPTCLVTEEQRELNRARMVDLGVAEWAVQDEGPDHLMIRMQPITKLLAGGIYQSRQKIDELEARIQVLEGQLCQT